MAGYQIVEPSAGSTDWTDFSTIVNNTMQGFMGLSLTNYDTTDVPLIAAGGQVEVAGSLYTFASTEAITGSLSTKQNYILLTTSSSSITASYTTDVPVWVPSKSGWYDSSTGSLRYMGGLSTDFGNKWVYDESRDIKNILADSGLLNSIGIKIGSDIRSTAGDQVITGVGFRPSIVIFITFDQSTATVNWSIGFDDGTIHMCMKIDTDNANINYDLIRSLFMDRGGGNSLKGIISAKSSDGFTINWVKLGTAPCRFIYLAIP